MYYMYLATYCVSRYCNTAYWGYCIRSVKSVTVVTCDLREYSMTCE